MKLQVKIKTKVVCINCSPKKFYVKRRRDIQNSGKWAIRVKQMVLFN